MRVSAIMELPRLGSVEILVKSEHVAISEQLERDVRNMFVDIPLVM